MITLNPGQSVDLTDTANYKDAAGNQFVDTAAKIGWADEGTDGAVSLNDKGTNAGVSVCTVTYVKAGKASVRATSTDPDGTTNSSGINNPSQIVCAATANTDASENDIVEGVPTP